MASHAFCTGPLPGTQLRTEQRASRQRRQRCAVAGVNKKVNTYDDKWSKVGSIFQACNISFLLSPSRR